jgi:hypothetical protein
MNRFKPVLKWLAIVLCVLGCEVFLLFLYLRITVRGYGDITGSALWQSFGFKLAIGLFCLGLSAVCFALYRFGSQLKRLKPLFKWLAVGSGIMISVLVVFLLEENIRGRIALRSYIRQLRGQGEKLTLAEIVLPKPPKDGNGPAVLMALTNQFDALRKDCPFDPGSVASRVQLVGLGRAVVRCEQPDVGVMNRKRLVPATGAAVGRGRRGREVEEGKTNATFLVPVNADWEDLAGQVAKASNVLEQIREALSQPVSSIEIDYSQGFDVRAPHLQAIRNAENWLKLAALHHLRHHNTEVATQYVLAVAKLTHFGQDERLLISQVHRYQRGMTGLNLTWEALQIPGMTDEQLSTLEQAWRASGVVENTASILEMDRLFYRNSFERTRQLLGWSALRTNLFYCSRGESGPSDLSEFFSDVRDGLHAVTWRVAWLGQDELRFLHRYQWMLDRARNAIARRDWSAFGLSDKDFPSAQGFYDRRRFLLSDAHTPAIEFALRRVLEFETQREMTIAAIGIKRYQLRTGKLPSDLTALVTEYLPQLPHDWMDGMPLRYHENPDGTFTLYSVGLDGRDDGGDPTPTEGKRAFSIWNERDAVWPMPASSAEIDAGQPKR